VKVGYRLANGSSRDNSSQRLANRNHRNDIGLSSRLTTPAHLVAINLGLRAIPVERRRHPGRNTRLLALVNGPIAAADAGMKERDRRARAAPGGAR